MSDTQLAIVIVLALLTFWDLAILHRGVIQNKPLPWVPDHGPLSNKHRIYLLVVGLSYFVGEFWFCSILFQAN